MKRRYVVVGGGIAALSALEAIRRHDSAGELTLVTDQREPFYSRPGLTHLLRGDVTEAQLRIRSPEEVRALRLTFVRGHAVRLFPSQHRLELSDVRSLSYDRLLLATGCQPCPLELEGADLDGVVSLGSLTDARDILDRARCGGRALVVGTGPNAIDLVEGFRARGLDTHLALPGQLPWPGVLDETESRLIERRLEEQHVTLHRGLQIRRIAGTGGRLDAVATATGDLLPCHILAVSLGVRPRTELAREAGLAVDRGILVDERLHTSAPDVWAAGDVVERTDSARRRPVLDTLWQSALAQGDAAGLDMAGAGAPYVPPAILTVVHPAGLTTTIVGLVGVRSDEPPAPMGWGESELFRLGAESRSVATATASTRIRLVLGERRILGAVVIGEPETARLVSRAVTRGRDVGTAGTAPSADPATAVARLLRACEERPSGSTSGLRGNL